MLAEDAARALGVVAEDALEMLAHHVDAQREQRLEIGLARRAEAPGRHSLESLFDAAEQARQTEGMRPVGDIEPADRRVTREQQPVGAADQVLRRHEADAALGRR